MFVIRSNVPVPSPMPSRQVPVYPLGDMKVGDSIAVPAPGGPDALAKTARQLYYAVQNQRRKHRDRKYTVRHQGDFVGIWRTA